MFVISDKVFFIPEDIKQNWKVSIVFYSINSAIVSEDWIRNAQVTFAAKKMKIICFQKENKLIYNLYKASKVLFSIVYATLSMKGYLKLRSLSL